MGLWARTTASKWLSCNCVVVIDEVEDKDRTDHAPNFFHFKNQQSSLDNHQSVPRDAVRSVCAWSTDQGTSDWLLACPGLRIRRTVTMSITGPKS